MRIGVTKSITLFQSSPTSKGGRYMAVTVRSVCGFMFQSSPTSKGGRYIILGSYQLLLQMFQSSPTSKGGRYKLEWAELQGADLVSILAHLERWALRQTMSLYINGLRFQSSPTSKGGRYTIKGRAIASACSSFNPRPPRKVGATSAFRGVHRCPHRFNPRPPRKVGATRLNARAFDRWRVSILAHLERWALRDFRRQSR